MAAPACGLRVVGAPQARDAQSRAGAAVPAGYGRSNFPAKWMVGDHPPRLLMAVMPETKTTQDLGDCACSPHNNLSAGQERLVGIFAVLVRHNLPSMRRNFAHQCAELLGSSVRVP